MNKSDFLSGTVEVEIISANLWGSLDKINQAGITVDSFSCKDEMTAYFRIKRKDYPDVSALCQKRGDRLLIHRKSGLYWTIQSFMKRPILNASFLMLIMLTIFLPTRIFFVRTEGNVHLPERRILSAARDVGICFGAKRRQVRSEGMKNALLSILPELKWAGVNTAGCTAVISVREQPDAPHPEEADLGVSSIVAGADGVIVSCSVSKGSLLCEVGQIVREGEVLISGYTDCGLVIQACRAEGEIYAETMHNLRIVTLNSVHTKKETGYRKNYSLLIGKKRINLWNSSRIWEDSCGRIYEENYLTLPGGFRLPVGIGKDTHILCDSNEEMIADVETGSLLKEAAENYLFSQILAGRILHQETIQERKNGHDHLTGCYLCMEMIGRSHMEEVGKQDG